MSKVVTLTSASERWRRTARDSILVRTSVRLNRAAQQLMSSESSAFVRWLTPDCPKSEFPHVSRIAASSRLLFCLEAILTWVLAVGREAATTRFYTAVCRSVRALQPRQRRQLTDYLLLGAVVTNVLIVTNTAMTGGPANLLSPITFLILAIVLRMQLPSTGRRKQAGTVPE